MFSRSISRTLAAPIASARQRSRMRTASLSRTAAVSAFESSTPRMACASAGMTTAHATTGPARGPRPTSSTPARSGPRASRNSRSIRLQRPPPRGTRPCLERLLGRDGRGLGLHFLDARGLAREVAQVVQLGAAHAATAHDVDLCQHGAVQREDALDTYTVGDLPDRERRAHAGSATRSADALEGLNALLLTFLDANVDTNGVTGAKGRDVAEPLFLGFDEGMHMTLGAGPGWRLTDRDWGS